MDSKERKNCSKRGISMQPKFGKQLDLCKETAGNCAASVAQTSALPARTEREAFCEGTLPVMGCGSPEPRWAPDSGHSNGVVRSAAQMHLPFFRGAQASAHMVLFLTTSQRGRPECELSKVSQGIWFAAPPASLPRSSPPHPHHPVPPPIVPADYSEVKGRM